MTLTPPKTKLSISNPSMEKAADTQASASATINAANLTNVFERRVTVAPGVSL